MTDQFYKWVLTKKYNEVIGRARSSTDHPYVRFLAETYKRTTSLASYNTLIENGNEKVPLTEEELSVVREVDGLWVMSVTPDDIWRGRHATIPYSSEAIPLFISKYKFSLWLSKKDLSLPTLTKKGTLPFLNVVEEYLIDIWGVDVIGDVMGCSNSKTIYKYDDWIIRFNEKLIEEYFSRMSGFNSKMADIISCL